MLIETKKKRKTIYKLNYKYYCLNLIFKVILINLFIKVIIISIDNFNTLWYKNIFFLFNKTNKKNIIKVCICTVGKLESNYILQFVEHYKKYGVDKIYLYDNNDINGERFDYILSDYIKDNYVEISNYRGKEGKQLKIFQNCYKQNHKNYDWLIFYDIDEFIYLKNYKNIKDFLTDKKFNKCQSIYLNWIIHTDNNLIYYDNRTLYERFPEIYINKNYCNGKTIIKGNIENIEMKTTHLLDIKIERCNGFGKKIKTNGIYCKKPDYKYYYIDHYYCKSTEEFINKINKGDGVFGYNNINKYKRINFYFKFNKITPEKIYFIANKSALNISILLKNLKKVKNNF